ncbi:hypothetical protein BBK82_07040 [Lentzea guizhouensis]|uniref:Uncharacterized protein n=2 Tax=Lentzea guizhouensis TaxID=1586287 RepID=A0A1B2HDR6_9PSEU|nr:hypothetical protein BBK82_07040 [Lentzea guizhouensis]
MGGKDRRSTGQRRAAKAKARQQRLAGQEFRREQHARLVVERAGDPRFIQRERLPDGGRVVRWDPESVAGTRISGALHHQLEKFREKFGRQPGPEDPIFFDPDAEDPTPLSAGSLSRELDRLVENADEIGVPPALIKAFRDLGYLVTEENRHLFSAAEIEAWRETVERYRAEDEPDDDDLGEEELVELLGAEISAVVARTLIEPSPQHARDFAARVIEMDLVLADAGVDDSAGALGLSAAFAVVARWLSGLREERAAEPVAEEVLGWVGSALGPASVALSRRAAGILGAPESSGVTVQELVDELEDDFLPALIWLAVGAVGCYGGGDVTWLQRFEVDPDHGAT